MKDAIASARATLGGIALGAGVIGLLLFVAGMVVNILFATLWQGAGARLGTQTMAEQVFSAQDQAFWWGMNHRLLPLFMISMVLIGYGWYEALNEKRRGSGRS